MDFLSLIDFELKDLQNTIEIHTKELLEQKMRNTEIVSLVEEEVYPFIKN